MFRQLYNEKEEYELAIEELNAALIIYKAIYNATESVFLQRCRVHELIAKASAGLKKTEQEIEHYEMAICVADSIREPPQVLSYYS